MSIVEQAAKRLEELRRSGATDGLATEAGSERSADATPTPELVMRALERHTEASVGSPLFNDAQRHPIPPASLRAQPGLRENTKRATRTTQPTTTQRRIDIDLAQLRALGFVTPDAPTSKIADEFRVIKRPIIRNATGSTGVRLRNGNLVMVTSSMPGEGKTFTALNLAISVAMEYDNTVLLVDGDVAHPGIPRVIGMPESPGLLDLLTNDRLDASEALLKTNIEKLTILPAGAPQRRATELLASAQMVALLDEMAHRYPDRIIIFDSPPLLPTTESRVLATHMGQIVMVVAAESTSQNTLNHAMSTIENCEVVLMMLNKARRTDVGTYGYYPADGGR